MMIEESSNKPHPPVSRRHERGLEAGGGRGSTGHKHEVVTPEEHLWGTDDWPPPLDGGRTLSFLWGNTTGEENLII